MRATPMSGPTNIQALKLNHSSYPTTNPFIYRKDQTRDYPKMPMESFSSFPLVRPPVHAAATFRRTKWKLEGKTALWLHQTRWRRYCCGQYVGAVTSTPWKWWEDALEAFIQVLERQYAKYFALDITDTLRKEVESARSHNIDAEELMGMFSTAQKKSPNATLFSELQNAYNEEQNCGLSWWPHRGTSWRYLEGSSDIKKDAKRTSWRYL